MNRLTLLLPTSIIATLAVCALAQWQVQPQIDPQVGPVYPENPSYNFHSQSNYNPYQFNWASGRWDYVPIPYDAGGSSGQNWQASPPPYRPYGNVNTPPYIYGAPPTLPPQSSAPSPTAVPPNIPTTPTPDDSGLWNRVPSTQPTSSKPPTPVTFSGRIVGIKAKDLTGIATPQLLLRLRNDAGAMGTVDVGDKLMFPEGTFDSNSKGYISATGVLGELDGHFVLFAQKITIGKTTIPVER